MVQVLVDIFDDKSKMIETKKVNFPNITQAKQYLNTLKSKQLIKGKPLVIDV